MSVYPAFSQNPFSAVASAGYLYSAPATVAPGQVISLFLVNHGEGQITATLQQTQSYSVPVLSVGPPVPSITPCPVNTIGCPPLLNLTVQIPYEMQSSCSGFCPDVVVPTSVFISQNGVASAALMLTPLPDKIHILSSCDTVVSGTGLAPTDGLPCAPLVTPLVTHADGSMVTAQSPARGNEELVAYAVRLGATNPAVPTGQAAIKSAPTVQSLLLSFDFLPNALPAQPYYPPGVTALTTYAYPRFTGLVTGYVGLYQINFVVPPPPEISACIGRVQSNLTINIGGNFSFDGAGICIVPGLGSFQSPGGQVELSTRAGSNDFHGGASLGAWYAT